MNTSRLLLLLPLLALAESGHGHLSWTPRFLQEKFGLPGRWTLPHGGTTTTAEENGVRVTARTLQTDDEACQAMLSAGGANVFGDCTCEPNAADGTFLVSCNFCPEPLQALNLDLAVTQSFALRYYALEVFDTYTVYAADRETVFQVYSGADAPVSSFTLTDIYTRGTSILEDCEVFWGDEECSCVYENCVIDGQPVRGETVECSQFSYSTCGQIDTPPDLTPVQDAIFDICPCVFADGDIDPEVCNGGTLAPFPSFPTPGPVSLPPSTAFPTTGDPPTIRAGFIPCTTNSDCQAFVEACIQGSCQAPLSPGEVCERDPITNLPDFSDCDNFACARANGAPDSPLICCPSGESTSVLDDSFNSEFYCAGLPSGEVCLSDDMCASQGCVDGICISDGTTAPPTPSPVPSSTNSPTQSPVVEPTTSSPTVAPVAETTTSSPTIAPVVEPTTSNPTIAPVVEPTTSNPTLAPVVEPTTSSPTVAPVAEPSSTPSSAPLPDDTLSPTSSFMPSTIPTSSPTTLPSTSPSQQQTSTALENFVMVVATNTSAAEIIAGVQAYLAEEMAAAYPDTFLRLELEQEASGRRRLESLALELIGTAYFLGSTPPTDVAEVQSAALADPQAVTEYLTASGTVDESTVVEAIVVVLTTDEPTVAPTAAPASTDEPTVGPTTEPSNSVMVGSMVPLGLSVLVVLSSFVL